MARKVFISFLGAGHYKPVEYATNTERKNLVRTRFVQEAFINEYCKDFSGKDRIFIFLTQKAEEKNWEGDFYKKEADLSDGLRVILEKNNKKDMIRAIKGLPNGKKEEEIWEIFDRVYKELEEGDEIIFDVTHAFRSIPILAMSLFRFSKFTLSTSLKRILYGAYDALNDDGTAQVWDLISYVTLQEYATGAAMFTNYGKGGYLSQIIHETNSHVTYGDPNFKNKRNLLGVSKGFAEFSDLLSINQIPGTFTIAKEFKKRLSKVDKENINLPQNKPFYEILEQIEKYISKTSSVKDGLFSESGFQAQIDIVNKCLEAKDFAQAISIARELFVSFFIHLKGGKDYLNNKEVRGPAEKELNHLAKENRKGGFQNVGLRKFLQTWDKVTEIRNAINHAFMDNSKKTWKFEMSSQKAEKACKEVEEIIYFNNLSKEDFVINSEDAISMLVNLSNHPGRHWPDNQKQAAEEKYGEVQDLSFPKIDPDWSTAQVQQLAEEYVHKVRKKNPAAVHIMGEMTFVYQVVCLLKEAGIPCIASTTNRKVIFDDIGNKTSTFEFIRFRNY